MMRSATSVVGLVLLLTACGAGDDGQETTEAATATTTAPTTSRPPETTTTTSTTTIATTTTTTTTQPPETTTTALPGGLDVTFGTEIVFEQTEDSVWESAMFTATGPAVDEGLICPAGTVELQGFDTGIGSWRREVLYKCDDGSGEFQMALQLKVAYTSDGYTESGAWSIEWGTGAYENLIGLGTDSTTQPDPNFYVSIQPGKVAQG